MVAQQVLVLFVLVRIQVGQLTKKGGTKVSPFFVLDNSFNSRNNIRNVDFLRYRRARRIEFRDEKVYIYSNNSFDTAGMYPFVPCIQYEIPRILLVRRKPIALQ